MTIPRETLDEILGEIECYSSCAAPDDMAHAIRCAIEAGATTEDLSLAAGPLWSDLIAEELNR